MLALTNLSSRSSRKPVAGHDDGGDGEFLYAYGTLRKGVPHNNHRIYPGLTYVETCTVPGKIYDLGWFPGIVLRKSGLVKPNHVVVCDKFKVEDDETWKHLDRYEGFYENDFEHSLYVRKRYKDGFIYEYNRSVEDKPLIENGDWALYVNNRTATRAYG